MESTLRQRWNVERIGAVIRSSDNWPISFPDKVIADLASASRYVLLPAGTQIATRGGKGDHLYLILSGLVRASSTAMDGREFLISMIEPGGFTGLLASLDNQPSSHDARAEVDTEALAISGARLRELMHASADVQDVVIALLCARLRKSFVGIEQFAIWSPQARLAARLLSLASTQGRRTPEGVRIETHVSQDTLAAMIGLSRQRTNKIIKDFERTGLLTVEYGHLVLRDLAGLERAIHSRHVLDRLNPAAR